MGLLSKFLFVMLMPIAIYFTNLSQFLSSLSSSFLFTSIGYSSYPPIIAMQSSSFQISGILLRNIILGLLVTFPGFIYNYKIERIPLNKSYWKMGLVICVVLLANTAGVVYFILPIFTGFSDIYHYYYDYYIVSSQLAYLPVLVMAAFVILPLIQRQATTIASPRETHGESMKELMQLPGLNMKRETRIAMILWVILCFFPIVSGQSFWDWGSYSASALFFEFSFYMDSFVDFGLMSFFAHVTNLGYIQLTALFSVGNFYYIRELYRYLRMEVTRKRLLEVGLLATFFPLLVIMVFPFGYYYYLYRIMIPIPSVFLLGYLTTRLHKSIIDSPDHIWKDEAYHYWWEEKKTDSKEEELIVSTPEAPYRSQNETITVPYYYLIMSRIKKLNNKGQS